jgi:hypothetical protein
MKNELYYICICYKYTHNYLNLNDFFHILLYNILLCENHNYKAQTPKNKCNTFSKQLYEPKRA